VPVATSQLPNLLKHFDRARLATPGVAGNPILHGLHNAIRGGGTDWLTKRHELAES
jgi:hypothetical protein